MKSHITMDFLRCLLKRRINFEVKDRITLGVIAGVIGNIVKTICNSLMLKMGFSDIGVQSKAAGMFTTRRYTKKPSGQGLGILVDFCIACKLGIMLVYLLSATGRDNHLLKGANMGQLAWVTMYGALSSLGVTNIHPVTPRTSFSNFITHSIFGMVAAMVIVTLGDPNLFKPRYNTLSNPSED